MRQSGLFGGHFLTVLLLLFPVAAAVLALANFRIGANEQEKALFVALNLVLLFYLVWEVTRVVRKDRQMAWIHAPVIASVMLFGKDFFMPSLPILIGSNNPNTERFLYPYGDDMHWLNSALLGVLAAAFCMWRGYHSSISRAFAVQTSLFLGRWALINGKFSVNIPVICVLMVLAAASVFIQISLGVFGYSSDQESFERTTDIRAWLGLLGSGGQLAFLVLSIAVFSGRRQKGALIWMLFLVSLVWQFAVGFLSGFKSQVVIPIIILGVSYYMARGRLSFILVIFALIMLNVAMATVEPFRIARYADPEFDGKSITSIVSTFYKAAIAGSYDYTFNQPLTFEEITSRTDLITFTAVAFSFLETATLGSGDPDFLRDLLRIPLNAYLPRFLWQDKTIVNDGWWFNVRVLGADPRSFSSTAMGPVSFLYFAGGYPAIILGFWVIGLLQRVAFDALIFKGLGGWIVYLGALQTLGTIPSNVAASMTGLLRMAPFLILAQLLVLRR